MDQGVQAPLNSSDRPQCAHTVLLNGEAAVGSGAGDIDDVRSQQGLVAQLERELCNAIPRDHVLPLLYLVVLGVLHSRERKLFQHLIDPHPAETELHNFSVVDYQALH